MRVLRSAVKLSGADQSAVTKNTQRMVYIAVLGTTALYTILASRNTPVAPCALLLNFNTQGQLSSINRFLYKEVMPPVVANLRLSYFLQTILTNLD